MQFSESLNRRSQSETRVQNQRVSTMYDDAAFCMETTAIASAFEHGVAFCSLMWRAIFPRATGKHSSQKNCKSRLTIFLSAAVWGINVPNGAKTDIVHCTNGKKSNNDAMTRQIVTVTLHVFKVSSDDKIKIKNHFYTPFLYLLIFLFLYYNFSSNTTQIDITLIFSYVYILCFNVESLFSYVCKN